ncbi:hypothetical protein [Halpernia sp.]|uniref:hypothetical protein n=1 Tax=Halpernia sp. TaxID=2782209 RepID=UPI003A93DE66
MEQTTFDQIRSRPRFKIFTETTKEKYALHLKEFLNSNESRFSGNINSETATISVKTKENPYWKPFLSLRTEFDSEKNITIICGVFGPSSSVWTFFMFLYFIFGISWMVCFTLFYVAKQIKQDGYSWSFPASILFLFFIFITYFIGRIGRKKGKQEMKELRNFAVESSLHLETKK